MNITSIFVQKQVLSDGSVVWNVLIGRETLRCISEKDAIALHDKLCVLISAHCN